MILDRFDGIVFVGDDLMKQIYASFNILLRRDLALGGMQQWKMTDKERDMCRCGGQYTKPDCWKFFVANHKDVQNHDDEGDTRSPYACDRGLGTLSTQCKLTEFSRRPSLLPSGLVLPSFW